MFGMGTGELIFIFLVVLLLFGPKKMPEVARTINKGMNQVKKAQAQFQDQINNIKDEVSTSVKDAENELYLKDTSKKPKDENK